MKTRIDKVDTIFAKCIRERDDNTCQWCGRQDGTMNCSHIFGRRHAATRWQPDNAVCKCFSCHRKWHENPVEGFRWLETYLGQGMIDILREKAYSVRKIKPAEKAEIYEHYKAEYLRLMEERMNGAQGKLTLGDPM